MSGPYLGSVSRPSNRRPPAASSSGGVSGSSSNPGEALRRSSRRPKFAVRSSVPYDRPIVIAEDEDSDEETFPGGGYSRTPPPTSSSVQRNRVEERDRAVSALHWLAPQDFRRRCGNSAVRSEAREASWRRGRDIRFVCFYDSDEKPRISSTENKELTKSRRAMKPRSFVTAAVLGVVYGITNSFRPFPMTFSVMVYACKLSITQGSKWKEPFDLRRGWLLWAGIGLSGAVLAIALAGVALAIFNGEKPEERVVKIPKQL
ncbi:hypothetical protein QJS10_CPA09g01498 [Acorus calamus]|uniref:Uncharacterized protein n=1 Tax=Acorus calamus TaxID=4465 RepID=A0AAV9E5T7_ACOCL|nr:hypothetical protein QJS10_CPA09g01498 [Acorus calamus]